MDRCPTCGFELPNVMNRTCYNCLGMENAAKRFGSRTPISRLKQKQWNRMRLERETKDAAQMYARRASSFERLPKACPITPQGRILRREGINRLLRDIYQHDVLISEILRDAGMSVAQVITLQNRRLGPFLDQLIPVWCKCWDETLPMHAGVLLCWRYDFSGRPRESRLSMARRLELEEQEVRVILSEALDLLNERPAQQEMARLAACVARRVLAS